MEFNKYKILGAYHWKEFEKQTIYGRHALKVKEWIRDGKTLDIGAGDGLITHLINAEGIDDNEIAVNLANERKVNVIIGSAYNLNYDDNSFDNIFMGDVIEHIQFPDIVINEIKRVLKNEGYFYIVTTPARSNRIVHDKYHYMEYTPDELRNYLMMFKFELINDIEIIEEYVRMYAIFKNIK